MLVAQNITKRFSGVTALDKVSLELHPGKVNAIIGENGAGKSTLMKILSGVDQDYEGKIIYRGNEVRFQNTRDAQNKGIAIIHQELNLIPYLSITDNLFLGRELTTTIGTLDKKAMRQQTKGLLQRLMIRAHPDDKIAALKVGEQQLVEIAKALLYKAEVIIMDEPTSAISNHEVAVLFDIIKDLKKAATTVVYISHKLDELFQIADRYSVLRDGRSIESGDMKGLTHDHLIRKMTGREVSVRKKAERIENNRTVFAIKGLCLSHPLRNGHQILNNISFELKSGEVLGIFGLMGAGRTELLETIFGLHPRQASGVIYVDEKPVTIHSPRDAIGAGLALVPEDRKKDGLVLGMNVRENISITTLEHLQQYGVVNRKQETLLARKYIGEMQIKTPSDSIEVKNLSGGNQQKIVIGKWLATKPRILLLDEPSRGIDVNAKKEIHHLIWQMAAEGLATIVVSSELPEIMSVADRILVMADGEITAELSASTASEDAILRAAISKSINV